MLSKSSNWDLLWLPPSLFLRVFDVVEWCVCRMGRKDGSTVDYKNGKMIK